MTEINFEKELLKLGITLDEIKIQQFETYFKLLVEWNEKINLTSIVNREDVYLKHFYDSATLTKMVDLTTIETLCDIGTGAGFPGIVIKILFPNIKVTLIDALDKRINFLNEVIRELNLKEIITVHARIEEYGIKNRNIYDVVTARAVASLPVLMEYTASLIKKGKYFIPMKANISQEISESKNATEQLHLKLIKKEEFLLPYEESNRTILLYIKEKDTPQRYPRKNAEIKKKPL